MYFLHRADAEDSIADSIAALGELREEGKIAAIGISNASVSQLPVGRAIAIAYASNAMAKSLPIIGSGAPTGFSYRRLVFQGAAPTVAGWALILAGIVSNAAFVVVISIGAIVSAGLAEGPDPRQAGPRRHCGDRETRGGYRRCRRRRCR